MSNETETVTVTLGEELYAPIQFNSFRVGPLSATTTLRKGETRDQAIDRLTAELQPSFEKQFKMKLADFKRRFMDANPRRV